MMKKIAVFCGASAGYSSIYAEDAKKLADAMSAANITLIYGGAKIGLMGLIADQMLKNKAEVVGVIPSFLAHVEVVHDNLTTLHMVDSMRERKKIMTELADAFIMLPGGPGSLEEFFEVFTLTKLNCHAKPCAILNTAGYYDSLLNFLDNSVTQGFLQQHHRDFIHVDNDAVSLINNLTKYTNKINSAA